MPGSSNAQLLNLPKDAFWIHLLPRLEEHPHTPTHLRNGSSVLAGALN